VIGVLRVARLPPADLDRTFFAEHFTRVLDASGYAVWKRWRVYGEEGLAGGEAALWLREKTLTVEHAGEPLSRYTVGFSASTGKPRAVARPVLFGTAIALPQPRLFGLEVLGEGGWLKTLRLEDYAPGKVRPGSLQQSPLPYHEARGRAPTSARSVPIEAASRGWAHRGTTAMASISTRKSGCANPATKAAVIAGGFGVSTHAR
jgi:hypothetical protein